MAVIGAMTGAVKDELARTAVGKTCCRRAEVATVLRLAGGVGLDGGRVVVAAELDTAAAAQRLRTLIGEVFGRHAAGVLTPTASNRRDGPGRDGHRWAVRAAAGETLARQAGLVDARGLVVRGLPAQVVGGALCDAEAVWRGAFLAAGSLSEAGKARALTITCPGGEPALTLALAGAARRLRVTAKVREVHGGGQVVITDRDAITVLLTRLGAPEAAGEWRACRGRGEARAGSPGAVAVPGLSQANLTRSALAARTAACQAARALEVLAGDVPAHLAAAARLRIDHPHLSLEQLGALCVPPLSKDAVAGRLRRVLALADARAAALGVPAVTGRTPDALLA